MTDLNRRHLLLGGAASLAGASAVPLLGAAPAHAEGTWRQVQFYGTPGGDRLTSFFGPFGILWATYSNSGGIVAQARMHIPSSGVQYWTKTPRQGRALALEPVNPSIGIFGEPSVQENYRINVNGFGVLVSRGAQARIRYQVVGQNGRRHWGDLPRYGNAANVQSLLNTFVDQTNTLNLQYRNYTNGLRQWGLAFPAAVTAGIGGLIVTGANPLTIIALMAAAATAGITFIGNVVTLQNTYMTTYNQMIETYERLYATFGLTVPDIARYDVGGVRWNRVETQQVTRSEFQVFNVPTS